MPDNDLLRIQQSNRMLNEMRKHATMPSLLSVRPPGQFGVEGSNRCAWCLDFYDRERRSLAEVERLRKVLMIDMTVPFDPPICDACYEQVTMSSLPREEVEKIGSVNNGVMANNGVPNLVLRNSAVSRT
jgi:hypothetical protein